MFRYDRPVAAPTAESAAMSGDRSQALSLEANLQNLIRLFWRRRVLIVVAALGCACLAVIVGKSLTPKYTATAQLYVDPRELQLVERELTPRAQDVSGLSIVAESQARLITSNSVLLRVIKNTQIDKDPEFGGKTAGWLGSLFARGTAPASDDTDALDALNRHVNVKRTDRTFIVDIDVWSRDPAKAAMLANAIADAYLAESKQSQSAAARRATADLSGRLKELQTRLRTAENQLALYKAQNNFVGSQDTLISDQQLSAITQRLAAARAVTLDAQAKYDQIEKARKAAQDAGAMPEALQSPTIANLRAQYSETRKRYAELRNELGPRHPTLLNMERQVEELRRSIGDEVNRFALAAKTDLARAREFEASLSKELERQKSQSVDLSQAAVHARELERNVEASRAVYLAFLKRSRETEEQETLNTSSARIIGEAVQPRIRTFPPAMSLLALLGLMFGAFAAAGYVFVISRLPSGDEPDPRADAAPKPETMAVPAMAAVGRSQAPHLQPRPAIAILEKPLLTCLEEADVLRTLSGILPAGGTPDLTRMGWPTLRGGAATAFVDAIRQLRTTATKRSAAGTVPMIAVLGLEGEPGRSIVTVNAALAAARDGARVLMIDADSVHHALSDRLSPRVAVPGNEPRVVAAGHGVSILPIPTGPAANPTARQLHDAIAQSRASHDFDLAIVDGPAMPWSSSDRELLRVSDALVAVLPTRLDINESMERILDALGDEQHKLIGVVLNEVGPTAASHSRGKQHA